MTDSDKNRQCMKILGYSPENAFRCPDFSHPALLGEMLAWFRDNGWTWILSHGDGVHESTYAIEVYPTGNLHCQTFTSSNSLNEAVRDALIAAGGEHA